MDLKDEIINDINKNRIMLYMKGTKDQPMMLILKRPMY